MKDKMGTLQSSLNCERISTSLQSCFGFGSSPGQYETETSKKLPQHPPVSSNNESENVATLQPNKKVSNKRRSSKEICCCRSAELDEFPYDVCSPSPDSQVGVFLLAVANCRKKRDIKFYVIYFFDVLSRDSLFLSNVVIVR